VAEGSVLAAASFDFFSWRRASANKRARGKQWGDWSLPRLSRGRWPGRP